MAPASLVTRIADGQKDFSLLNTRGTVWSGQTDLVSQGRLIGFLIWSLEPLSLFSLSPLFDWQLDQTSAQLHGSARFAEFTKISATGKVQAAAVNEWVDQYDIYLEGYFDVTDLSAEVDLQNRRLTATNGSIQFSGGMVRFKLSGLLYAQQLPPMLASFEVHKGLPRAVVVAIGDSIPLMIFQPGAPGFIKIGITQRFTEILNRPWPGGHPPHAIVLEVEESFL